MLMRFEDYVKGGKFQQAVNRACEEAGQKSLDLGFCDATPMVRLPEQHSVQRAKEPVLPSTHTLHAADWLLSHLKY